MHTFMAYVESCIQIIYYIYVHKVDAQRINIQWQA